MVDLAALKKKCLDIPRWDFYALFLLFCVMVVQASSWPNFPLFMDCYYHLSVMRGFADAGGWVGVAFWEYAPWGRPHLYPPLFHLLELILFRLGWHPILIAKFSDFLIYPVFLFIIWRVVRRLYSNRLAFFSLFLLVPSGSFYLAVINNTPFTLAILFGLLAFYFIKQHRSLSAVLSLALAFYAHNLASWIIFFLIFACGFFSSRERRGIFSVCLMALALAAPLLWHQARHIGFFHPRRVLEFYYAQVHLVLYLAAALGLVLALKKKGLFLFPAAFLLIMSVLLLTHRDRFLSGHGLLPMSLLAAFLLDGVWERWASVRQKAALFLFWFFAVFFFYIAQPLLVFSPERAAAVRFGSGFAACQRAGGDFRSSKGESLYYRKFIDETVRLVRRHSEEDEIIFSNYPYAGGLVAVLAHRATSFAMLGEVAAFTEADPVRGAHLVLWLKDESGAVPPVLAALSGALGLKRAGETDLFYLYRNEAASQRRQVRKAVVPERACFFILAAVFCVFLLENKKLT